MGISDKFVIKNVLTILSMHKENDMIVVYAQRITLHHYIVGGGNSS